MASRTQRLWTRARNSKSLFAVMVSGVSLVLLTVYDTVARFIVTVGETVIVPIGELTDAAGGLIDGIFGSAGLILRQGGITTAVSIAPGGTFDLGPLTFALSVGSVVAALWVVNAYLSEEATGNFVPGIPFDVPTPGFTGPEEDEEGG